MTRGDLASRFAGMVFYMTNVGYRFPSTRLMHKPQKNIDVQLATCQCDKCLRAEGKIPPAPSIQMTGVNLVLTAVHRI